MSIRRIDTNIHLQKVARFLNKRERVKSWKSASSVNMDIIEFTIDSQ